MASEQETHQPLTADWHSIETGTAQGHRLEIGRNLRLEYYTLDPGSLVTPNRQRATKSATTRMESWTLLKSLLMLLLVEISRQGVTDPVCDKGFRWSNDLERCKDCRLCEISSKDDFCQTCDSQDKQADFPLLWVIVSVAVSAFMFTFVITLTIYLIHCRRKNKFTTPIEETGAHSAEELLIH